MDTVAGVRSGKEKVEATWQMGDTLTCEREEGWQVDEKDNKQREAKGEDRGEDKEGCRRELEGEDSHDGKREDYRGKAKKVVEHEKEKIASETGEDERDDEDDDEDEKKMGGGVQLLLHAMVQKRGKTMVEHAQPLMRGRQIPSVEQCESNVLIAVVNVYFHLETSE